MMSEKNSADIASHQGASDNEKDGVGDMQSAEHGAAAKVAGIPHSDSGIVVSPQTPEDQENLAGALAAQQISATSQEGPSDITVTPQSPGNQAHVAVGSGNDIEQNDTGTSVSTAEQNPCAEKGCEKSPDSPEKKSPSKSSVPLSQRSPVNLKSPSKSPRSTSQVTDAEECQLLHLSGAGDDDPLHLSKSEMYKVAHGNDLNKQAQKLSSALSPTLFGKKISPRFHQHLGRSYGDGNTSSAPTPSPRASGEFGNRSARSPRSHKDQSRNKVSPDSFTYETKYVVLQFLHQTTNEQNFVNLSQSSRSQSSASESESRWRALSHTQKLRAQWRIGRSSSQPTSPKSNRHPLAKTKGNRSSPNLKDAGFFKENLPSSSVVKLPGSQRVNRPATGAMSRVRQDVGFVRSVSDYTEHSENGDADDELDASFDSSQNSSVVSHSLKDRMASVHASRLPTVPSEADAVTEMECRYAASNTSDATLTGEMQGVAGNEVVMDAAVSLDMIQIEEGPLSPVDAFNRVQLYLEQMECSCSQGLMPSDMLDGVEGSAFTPDTTLQEGQDEVDSPLFSRTMVPDSDPYVTGEFQPETTEGDIECDGDGHPAFYQSSGSDNQNMDTEEGAVGGRDEDDGDDVADCGDDNEAEMGRGDRNNLRLDLLSVDSSSDPAFLVDAVQSLQQELEEELSSFESEFEEAMQNLQSDSSLGRSRSISPDTAEAARILKMIGDRANQEHFQDFEIAASRLFLSWSAGLFTYDNFRQAAMTVLTDDMDGWRQVSILLLYSQHVALHMARYGHRGVHRIVDYTVRLLADTAADFILRQGGWAAISSIGQSSSSSPEIGPTRNPLNGSGHSSSGQVHSTGVDPIDLTNLPEGFGAMHGPDTGSIHSNSSRQVRSSGVDSINLANLPGPGPNLLPPITTENTLVTGGQSLPSMEEGGETTNQQGAAGPKIAQSGQEMDLLESSSILNNFAHFSGLQINHDLVGGATDAVPNLCQDEVVPPSDAVILGGEDGCERSGAMNAENAGAGGPENSQVTEPENINDGYCPENTEEQVPSPECLDGSVASEKQGDSQNANGDASPDPASSQSESTGGGNIISSVFENIVADPRLAMSYAVSFGIVAAGAAVMLGLHYG